jgi:hypothetical protein
LVAQKVLRILGIFEEDFAFFKWSKDIQIGRRPSSSDKARNFEKSTFSQNFDLRPAARQAQIIHVSSKNDFQGIFDD